MSEKLYNLVNKTLESMNSQVLEMQSFYRYHKITSTDRRILNNNLKLKNKFVGRRCFVLGNGPSLKELDLSLLKEEQVFTVNQLMRDERFPQLSTNFHIFADPQYYQMDPENKYHLKLIEMIRNLGKGDNKTEVFFPIEAREFIEKMQLDNLSINYFLVGCNMYENYKKEIDYTKGIPGFYTVVQYAISLAIYCGFSEIYLLGCDMTGYKQMERRILGAQDTEHSYTMTKEELQKGLHYEELSCETFFNGYAKMFVDYRRLYEYTQKRKIKLINLTKGGLLDSIPRQSFETLLY